MKRAPLPEAAPLAADRVEPFTGTRPYLATGSVGDEADLTPVEVTYADRPSRADLTIQAGDVSFARMQGTKKILEFDQDHTELILSTGFAVLRPDPNELHSGYLRHWLSSDMFQAEKDRLCSGATQKAITNEKMSLLTIPLPARVEEQRRIAEILDKADELRAKRRVALAQLGTFIQSIFLDLFGNPSTNPNGFPKKQLTELVRGNDTINYGVVQPGDDLEEGVPLVRVSDLVEGKIRHTSLKRISPSIEAAYKRSRLRGDEVLLVCVGATAGVVALADETAKGFNIARAIARIPLAEHTDPHFVAAYLRTEWVQRRFQNELRTVAQPTLNIKQISELPVVHPPLKLQSVFRRHVAAVEKLIIVHRASLAGLDALFAALQHRAFRGEL